MNAQEIRDTFWNLFDKYHEKQGKPFSIVHVKGGKNQNAGNINNPSPMAMQTLSCEIIPTQNIILVQVYINHNVYLFESLYAKREKFERELGYSVEWVMQGKIAKDVRRIQKKFYINRPYEEMIEFIYPYILDFIKVFGDYV